MPPEALGPQQLIEHIVAVEEKDRARRASSGAAPEVGSTIQAHGRLRLAMAEEDRPLLSIRRAPRFVESARNVVLVAPQGLGKTMIAQNIAHQAILAGHGVLFVSAAQLLLDLAAQDSARALERRLKYYARVGLLVLDEIGFLAFDNRNADLLFQVVSRRYEKKSLVLTTNLAFRDWPTIFPNATCATALIDRVVHHAEVVVIEGESYRAREAELDAKARRSKKKVKEQEATSDT